MRRFQKHMLRNEHRKDHRRAPRREIGRSPNWVIAELRERRRPDEEVENETS